VNITEFLLARIAEDEREANACLDQWMRGDGGSHRRWERVLAECETKRRLVEFHTDGDRCVSVSGEVCEACHYGVSPCHGDVLRTLAAVYADHPDYDPAWAC